MLGQNMNRYWLCKHVHVCSVPMGGVILNLHTNRYLGLGLEEMHALAPFVAGWPQSDEMSTRSVGVSSDEAVTFADSLVEAGILTTNESAGRAAAPVTRSAISATSVDSSVPRAFRTRDVLNFVVAVAIAYGLLRFVSMKTIVERVEREKRALRGEFDSDHAAALAELFRRMRPFLFTSKGRCLLQALALVQFLARYGQTAHWMFGVKTCPFAAHSWVERDGLLLDCTPEEVSFYVPILAV
jgi:hypothetical protein